MSSKKSKNTPVAGERAVTVLEWAKAFLQSASEGALVEGNPDPHNLNPFIQRTGARDTINYVRCSLEAVAERWGGIGESQDLEFGRYLILQTMVRALEIADGQIQHDEKVARARGIVDALEGAP
jgi:hypothetical protein